MARSKKRKKKSVTTNVSAIGVLRAGSEVKRREALPSLAPTLRPCL